MGTDNIQAARDQLNAARELCSGDDCSTSYEGHNPMADREIQFAQAEALVSIAESLARLAETFDPPMPTLDGETMPDDLGLIGQLLWQRRQRKQTVAPSWSPEEAAILAMPAPKGHVCPACRHGVHMHLLHGCDAAACDCPQPFGRILPGDPDPTSGQP